MSIYAIGDLHLSLSPNIAKPMDIFGDRWFNHTERLKENWKQIIIHDDTVIIAGDISWGIKFEEAAYDLEWIDRLPGRKICIKGNHDFWWSGINRLNRTYKTISFLQNNSIYLQSEDVYICGSRGWITPDDEEFTEADKRVYRRELLRLEASLKSAKSMDCEGEIIGFLHYPPVSRIDSFSGFMQLFEDYSVKEVYYGHIHGEDGFKNTIQGEYYGTKYRLISADYLNMKPLKVR
ncbi:MAG: metallophosphoesterase [Lentihominibacter sp.]|jgi:predicted phosphohydrolase